MATNNGRFLIAVKLSTLRAMCPSTYYDAVMEYTVCDVHTGVETTDAILKFPTEMILEAGVQPRLVEYEEETEETF